MSLRTKVVIVGAGPTGLSMAAQLLRHQIDFVILEKNEKTTPLSKALVVQARTLEIFDELGIAGQAVQEGQITTGLNFFYQGKQRAAIDISGLGKGISPFPYALSLEQCKTEKILVDFLSANGKNVQWGSAFTRFKQNDNEVSVYCTDHTGQEQQIDAEYLVGCDGAGSQIRHQLGLPFEGDTAPKIFYVADVQIKSPVINKNQLFMFMIKKGFILFFPMEGEGHFRVVGILPEDTGVPEAIQFPDIEPSIKENIIVPLDFEEVKWFSSYKVHSRKAGSFENGRCFIAGDAAHIHTPAGGQGMNTGIQDAYNLAWKIAFQIKGSVSPDVIQSYSLERSENAKHLLKTTDRMFDIMSGKNSFWNFLRLHFFVRIIGLVTRNPAIKKLIFPLISQTGITYHNSPLTIHSAVGKVKAGVRMPHFVFSDGSPILGYLRDPVFKLLFFGRDENNNFSQISQIKDKKLKLVSKAFEEIPSSLFGSQKNFYILLRPDNHIIYIGKDIGICKDFLLKISHA